MSRHARSIAVPRCLDEAAQTTFGHAIVTRYDDPGLFEELNLPHKCLGDSVPLGVCGVNPNAESANVGRFARDEPAMRSSAEVTGVRTAARGVTLGLKPERVVAAAHGASMPQLSSETIPLARS
jgi:hypothetical protein